MNAMHWCLLFPAGSRMRMVGAVEGSHALFARNGDTARSIASAHRRACSSCLPSNMPVLPPLPTGFELGIKTMKPGGKRRIVVPPELGPPVSTQKCLWPSPRMLVALSAQHPLRGCAVTVLWLRAEDQHLHGVRIVPPLLQVGPATFFSAKQYEVFDVELRSVKTCRCAAVRLSLQCCAAAAGCCCCWWMCGAAWSCVWCRLGSSWPAGRLVGMPCC